MWPVGLVIVGQIYSFFSVCSRKWFRNQQTNKIKQNRLIINVRVCVWLSLRVLNQRVNNTDIYLFKRNVSPTTVVCATRLVKFGKYRKSVLKFESHILKRAVLSHICDTLINLMTVENHTLKKSLKWAETSKTEKHIFPLSLLKYFLRNFPQSRFISFQKFSVTGRWSVCLLEIMEPRDSDFEQASTRWKLSLFVDH